MQGETCGHGWRYRLTLGAGVLLVVAVCLLMGLMACGPDSVDHEQLDGWEQLVRQHCNTLWQGLTTATAQGVSDFDTTSRRG